MTSTEWLVLHVSLKIGQDLQDDRSLCPYLHVDREDLPNTKKFINILDTHNLEQHVTGSTHKHGHTLDLLITRTTDNIIDKVTVKEFKYSDHHSVRFRVLTSKPPLPKKTISFRRFKSLDVEEFKADIFQSELYSIKTDDPNELVEKYNTVLRNLLDKHIPVQTKSVTVRPLAPWYNQDISDTIILKKKAERTWLKSRDPYDKDIFCQLRNSVTNKIKSAKKSYFQEKISSAQNSQQSLFKCVNELLKTKKKAVLPNNIPDDKVANELSSFFTGKIEKIYANFDDSQPVLPPTSIPALHSFSPATCDEVRKLILSSASKSCSLDPIPTYLLKECLDVLLPIIVKIINLSLLSAIVPEEFKKAVVTPILKKLGLDPNILSNYRPVSGLSFLSKLLEKIVSIRLHAHKHQHNLIEKFQSAYRKGHSTESAVTRVHNDILRSIDNGKCVFLVLLDLSAAFDTVSHDILLKRLQSRFGISGSAHEWIASYLNHRSQCVQANSTTSDSVTLKYGVPQGSVLGPDFFSDYTSELSSIIAKFGIKFHCYADDTQLYIEFTPGLDESSVLARLEQCIDELRKWMFCNKLKFNECKTEFIILGTPSRLKKITTTSLQVGSQSVASSPSVRNIGAYFDSSLRMDVQVRNTCKVAWLHLRSISKIKSYLTVDQLKAVMQAYVVSHMDYNNSLLARSPDKLIEKLQLVQNAAARLVTGTRKYDHITPVLQQLHWLPVRQRIAFKILFLTFKVLHGTGPSYLLDLLTRHLPSCALRSSSAPLLLDVPRTRLKTYGDRSFSAFVPVHWNQLPGYIRSLDSISSFKTALKTHLFRNYYTA